MNLDFSFRMAQSAWDNREPKEWEDPEEEEEGEEIEVWTDEELDLVRPVQSKER